VVVHGEREVLPSSTRAEAAKALEQFTSAYNKADKAYDSSLDADHVTGALGDIDAARLKAGHTLSASGNPAELTTPHAVELDSAASLGRWRDDLTAEEVETLRERTRDVWPRFYSDVDW